jgi:hypothetical protein
VILVNKQGDMSEKEFTFSNKALTLETDKFGKTLF